MQTAPPGPLGNRGNRPGDLRIVIRSTLRTTGTTSPGRIRPREMDILLVDHLFVRFVEGASTAGDAAVQCHGLHHKGHRGKLQIRAHEALWHVFRSRSRSVTSASSKWSRGGSSGRTWPGEWRSCGEFATSARGGPVPNCPAGLARRNHGSLGAIAGGARGAGGVGPADRTGAAMAPSRLPP